MAKKKTDVTNIEIKEVHMQETTNVGKTIAELKSACKTEIDNLVKEWNDSCKYAEYNKMADIEAKLAEKSAEYNEHLTKEEFMKLEKADDPMKALALQQRIPAIKVRKAKSKESKMDVMTVEESTKEVDPKALDDYIDGGIGADKEWICKAEALNFLFTSRIKYQSFSDSETDESVRKELLAVKNCYKMADAAMVMANFKCGESFEKFDSVAADDFLLEELQAEIDAMLGTGHKVQKFHLNYILNHYCKKDRKKSNEVKCETHQAFRIDLLDVCNMILTGATCFGVSYKVK